ncbi:neuronal acetylcholine receptor subunit beta-3-like [Pecten maximus]|uniref:neuronal acetylcholine receptor subunit beta-3-like n=1 Tax=Pecten maximus TaxID=6579 RepID=UPI001458EBDB|nr:neuronal acetylcholine receptor subunit beta-3-like [Pecten maximus]
MKPTDNLLTWFLLVLMVTVTISSPTLQDVKDVYKHIFNGYDNRIRPVINQSDTIPVSMMFLLNSINEFDEKAQRLVISGWFSIRWIDESLAWNGSDFGNVSHVYVDGSSIWQPNIALINTFGRLNMLSQLASKAEIMADGKVEWFPADSFVVTCEVDITYYPFDTQTCHMEFEIWDEPSSKVAFITTPESINIKYFEENVEWKLVSSEIESAELDLESNSFVILFIMSTAAAEIRYIDDHFSRHPPGLSKRLCILNSTFIWREEFLLCDRVPVVRCVSGNYQFRTSS